MSPKDAQTRALAACDICRNHRAEALALLTLDLPPTRHSPLPTALGHLRQQIDDGLEAATAEAQASHWQEAALPARDANDALMAGIQAVYPDPDPTTPPGSVIMPLTASRAATTLSAASWPRPAAHAARTTCPSGSTGRKPQSCITSSCSGNAAPTSSRITSAPECLPRSSFPRCAARPRAVAWSWVSGQTEPPPGSIAGQTEQVIIKPIPRGDVPP